MIHPVRHTEVLANWAQASLELGEAKREIARLHAELHAALLNNMQLRQQQVLCPVLTVNILL